MLLRIDSMIYLDHAATTPPLEEALRQAWPWLTTRFGNPSSQHAAGRDAARALAGARNVIADLLGTGPQGIVFTSGGTESVNLAIRGIARQQPRGRHIISTPIEHSCVLRTLENLEKQDGFRIDWLAVDANGVVDTSELENLLSNDTTLVSVSSVNNETGSMQPMDHIRNACASRNVPLHDDAIQSTGWLHTSLKGIDQGLLSLSGHKIGAPKGIGVLACSRGLDLAPMMTGGGQEHGMRSGTQNVGFAVAMATALEHALDERPAASDMLAQRIRSFEQRLADAIPDVQFLVNSACHLPVIRTVLFEGIQGGVLLQELDRAGICASSGSACSSGSDNVSHVLEAMGVDEDIIRSAVRFSFSPSTSKAELDRAADLIIEAVRSFQSLR